MIYYSYGATILTLGLSWYFYGWQLAIVVLAIHISIMLHYLSLKISIATHKIEKGTPLKEVIKNIL